MNFINQKTNKQKVLNFVLRSNGSWRVKNALKSFLKYLREGICKIKQYLNYILMIINQNILATLLTFSNLQKNLYEKLYTKETTSKTTTTEFISKIPNRKIPNFQVMMAYQQNVMNIFQINQLMIFQMFMTPVENLAPWVFQNRNHVCHI